jgi:hypothetical protein
MRWAASLNKLLCVMLKPLLCEAAWLSGRSQQKTLHGFTFLQMLQRSSLEGKAEHGY